MSTIVLDNKIIFSNDKSYYVLWRQKGGIPIPVGKGSRFTPVQRTKHNRTKIAELKRKRAGADEEGRSKIDKEIASREKHIKAVKAVEKKTEIERKPPTKTAAEEEKMLSEGKIVESTPIGMGVTNPTLVTFEDGSQGVFKPSAELGRNFGVPPSNMPKNEVAAYELDKALGFNIVPPTVSRDFQGERGSMQRFVRGHKTAEEHSGKIDRDGFQKMRALDTLTWNMDRHDGNYLVSKGGRVKAIDNGFSLPPEVKRGATMFSPGTAIMNAPKGKTLNYSDTNKIPSNIMTGLKGLTDTKIKQALVSSGNKSTKVFLGIKKRRDILLGANEFPSVAAMNSNMEGWF